MFETIVTFMFNVKGTLRSENGKQFYSLAYHARVGSINGDDDVPLDSSRYLSAHS